MAVPVKWAFPLIALVASAIALWYSLPPFLGQFDRNPDPFPGGLSFEVPEFGDTAFAMAPRGRVAMIYWGGDSLVCVRELRSVGVNELLIALRQSRRPTWKDSL